jgi:flagellin-like protein
LTSNPPFSFFVKKRENVVTVKKVNKKRAGVSPVIATIIIIAITIVTGLALFAYTNSQADVATAAFSQEATDYINYRNDRFVVANLSFNESDSCITATPEYCLTAYVFNNGNLPVTITTISAGKDDSQMVPYCVDTLEQYVLIEPKNMSAIPFYGPATVDPSDGTVSCPPALPETVEEGIYSIRVTSTTGAYQLFFQKFTEAV